MATVFKDSHEIYEDTPVYLRQTTDAVICVSTASFH